MCGNKATLILAKTEEEGNRLKSHKHHKSTESMVSGGDPKREQVPPGRHNEQSGSFGMMKDYCWGCLVLEIDKTQVLVDFTMVGL
jgi:hypothetical protein